MKIDAVSNVNAFKGAQDVSAATSPNEKKDIKEVIKDNKGKIALGLSALAAVGVAAVAISRGKKVPSNVGLDDFTKVPSELSIDDFKKIGKFDKGTATVKGKPFSGVINVTNKKGKYALEYTDGVLKSSTKYIDRGESLGYKIGFQPHSKKVYMEKDGVRTVENLDRDYSPKAADAWLPGRRRTIITDNKIVNEHKSYKTAPTLQDVVEKQQDGTWKKTFQEMVFVPDYSFKNKNYNRYYISTKDEAGNVIAKKFVREPVINSGETVLRKTEVSMDEYGRKYYLTTKNGKPFAKRYIILNYDGSKRIQVEYPNGTKKFINISADGTRKESTIDCSVSTAVERLWRSFFNSSSHQTLSTLQ